MSDAQAAQPLLGQNVSKAINAEGSQTYVRYRRRWLTLSIVLLLQMSNAMLWLAYSPIANIAAEHYNTSAQTINWLSLLFMVVYIPIGPVAMWCLDTKVKFALLFPACKYQLTGVAIFSDSGKRYKYGGGLDKIRWGTASSP
eukprot:m.84749 g.84749  ORF g.84749 m.84749 type:complete len:142 (+) comp12978_c0_seq4:206-631(+)